MISIHPPVSSSRVSRRVVFRAGVAAASLVVLAACGSDGGAAEPVASAPTASVAQDAQYTIVVSDPPIADLVAQVAGDGVEVVSVVPMGANGHTYEPVPEDARTLAEADMYIENGMSFGELPGGHPAPRAG
jgi:ABC-type Zn uptake system ZnuABC Zn-binding protein ZnuA